MKNDYETELENGHRIMQRCIRHVVPRVIRISIGRQYSNRTNDTKQKIITEGKQDHGLICSEWEEAMIEEQRMLDILLDSMQQNTIDGIHNSSNGSSKCNNENKQ